MRPMARKAIFRHPRRVNILIEKEVHSAACKRVEQFNLRGGFGEYVTRLIIADQERKGRELMRARRVTA